MTRREFIGTGAALATMTALGAEAERKGNLRVKFLGTGAADWCKTTGPKPDGEWRRRSSVLLNGEVLVDFTDYNFDMLGDAKPEAVFYTHQHNDHYSASAATKAGVKRAYVHRSWAEHAKAQFADEARKQGRPSVEVVAIGFFEKIAYKDCIFTLLPANHCCDRPEWEAGVYAIRRGATHLYYATDTAYCNDRAWCFYVMKEPPFTAIIHEATLHHKDTRITGHSSVDMVEYLVRAMSYRKYYLPPEGRKVYLTHLSRNSQLPHAELVRSLSNGPLVPAHDGLEVVL